jgi:hypothetical protein
MKGSRCQARRQRAGRSGRAGVADGGELLLRGDARAHLGAQAGVHARLAALSHVAGCFTGGVGGGLLLAGAECLRQPQIGGHHDEQRHQADPGHVFSIIGRKVIKPADFADLNALAARLTAFEPRFNATATPFDWRFGRHELDDLLRRIDAQHLTELAPLAA